MAQIRPEILAHLLNTYLVHQVGRLKREKYPTLEYFPSWKEEKRIWRGVEIEAILSVAWKQVVNGHAVDRLLYAWSEDEYRRRLQQFEDYALGIDAAPEPLSPWCERVP